MLALVVHAHSEPRSLNAAMKDTAAATLRVAECEVEALHLYGKQFDPVV